MIEKNIQKLTNDEYFVLVKIAKELNCDVWCYVCLTDRGESDYIYDKEYKNNLSLYDGIRCLCEAMDCKENWDNCNLTEDEKNTFYNLCDDLGIDFEGYEN